MIQQGLVEYLNKMELLADMLEVFGLRHRIALLLGDMPEALRIVRFAAIKEEVKRKFREKGGIAFQAHPDHGGSNEAFRAVKRVYDTIQSFDLHAEMPMVKVPCPYCQGRGFTEQLAC